MPAAADCALGRLLERGRRLLVRTGGCGRELPRVQVGLVCQRRCKRLMNLSASGRNGRVIDGRAEHGVGETHAILLDAHQRLGLRLGKRAAERLRRLANRSDRDVRPGGGDEQRDPGLMRKVLDPPQEGTLDSGGDRQRFLEWLQPRELLG